MIRRVYIFSVMLIAVYLTSLYVLCTNFEKELNDKEQNTEVVLQVIPMEEQNEIETPDISEEIANQEAKEPEWGFDFEYICRVVAAESRGEPYEGQVAVARCIWNSANAKMMTMEEIVKLPNRYTDPVPSDLVTESVRNACVDAFLGMNLPTEEPIEYFYSIANGGYSAWHENALEHVITIGNHKFFKEK